MNPQSASLGQAGLTDCDREPIRIPGSIQPHGLLLVLDPGSMTIVQLAGDTERLLGRTHDQLLGQSLSASLDATAKVRIESMIRRRQILPRPMFIAETCFGDRPLEVSAHLSGALVILELERRVPSEGFDVIAALPAMTTRADLADSMETLLNVVTAEVGIATGFDRVMLYRFDEDYSGSVVAEHRSSDQVESFLDLRYPASDIPVQARELYCNNRICLIPDVFYQPQLLDPPDDPATGRPLDLSFSALRSVSPSHVEYLANMGIAASMSLSLVVGGKLWGLIACHHSKPLYLGARTRAALVLFAQLVSLQVRNRLDLAQSTGRMRARDVQAQLAAALTEGGLPQLIFGDVTLLDLIPAAGAALVVEGETRLLGVTPPLDDVKAMAEWLGPLMDTGVFATDRLSQHYPAAAGYLAAGAGLLALSVSRTPRDYVLWFLPELINTVTWAGDPAKSMVHGPLGARLIPRKSFAAWTEMVEGRSRPWTSVEIEDAISLRTAILDYVQRRRDRFAREQQALENLKFNEMLEQQVAQRTSQLVAANKELDDFAYVASHDLKAPLRVIDNASKWLEEDLAAHLDDETRDTMRLLRGRVKRMEKLLDDLLQYCRVGRTSDPAAEEMVAGNEIVDNVLALLSPAAGFKFTVGSGFAGIRLPRMPLQQILMNLIGNAIKHHDSKEGHIELSVEDRGAVYEFAVKDDGPGIPAQFHDEIFKIFRTLKPRDQVEGSGMGLAIVRKHIDVAGGMLWLESAEGEGSTFRFTWPKPPQREEGKS